ncbi:uncharacterized protein FIBRA_07238 [Fibroporia radiculosa]|uniref:ABM domain-containing protein n=1 Tax=Fibroporia radiculosa TaxID=599839 RepID=J4IBP8_9APHY|nr:uncharacterized protein FIBRA_07238 [Fibroporia radiculosa]CCM05036.1 predicted protein [Fibroporia radiculosa]
MSLPIIEIIHGKAIDAVTADPWNKAIVGPALDIVGNAPGSLKIYRGLQTEEPKHLYVYVAWTELQAHKNFQADPVNYPEVGKRVGSFMVSDRDMFHVEPSADPYKALNAPVTELALLTPRPGYTKENVAEKVKTLVESPHSLQEDLGLISAFWGPVVEKENTLALIVGWKSVEAQRGIFAVPQVAALLKACSEVAELQVTLASLLEYP